MCKQGDQIIIIRPWDNKEISIDRCISTQIEDLWNEGIETIGCCCGHGLLMPSVCIPEQYDNKKINKIRNILIKSDPKRRWEILQWRLVSV